MFDLRIEPCKTIQEREEAILWIRSQANHEHYKGLAGSSLFRIRQNGRIVSVFELSTVTVLSSVFDVSGTSQTTFRSAEAMFHAVESGGISPIIECNEKSPLAPYMEKIGTEIFKDTRFFVR